MNSVKSLFITLPLREISDSSPPFGVMAVMNALIESGFTNTSFYHIDFIRPSTEEALDFIVDNKPDILCISAPVSTSYAMAKSFSLEIKKRLPKTLIVLGGNLAASAEVLLRRTGVDICVLGEGERTCVQIFQHFEENHNVEGIEKYPGLAFLKNGELVNTGYAEQLSVKEIYRFSWDSLEEKAKEFYIPTLKELGVDSPLVKCFFPELPRMKKEERDELLGKRVGKVLTSKGCVARCTFCHRFTKGIRIIPPEEVVKRVKKLNEEFNLAAVSFDDECFGVNPKWVKEFCALIKPLNLRWRASGVRASSVTEETIQLMKDAGARIILYGIESGSEDILKVMEKKLHVEQNFKALDWTIRNGIQSIPQIVLGMPGENQRTIKETADFLSDVMTISHELSPRDISVNYAQALPGTPLYEYGRTIGAMGRTLDDEEEYLLAVSDKNAIDLSAATNLTTSPDYIFESWRAYIFICVNYAYCRKFGKEHYYKIINAIERNDKKKYVDQHPVFFYCFRNVIWMLYFAKNLKKKGISLWWRESVNLLKYLMGTQEENTQKSLRKTLDQDIPEAYHGNSEMIPLRKGR